MLFFEISEPKLQKTFRFQIFWAKFEKLNISDPRIKPTYSSTTLLLRSSCIDPAAKNEFQRVIAEQRQEFEARLEEQDPKFKK